MLKRQLVRTVFLSAAIVSVSLISAFSQVQVASDTANDPAYAPQPDHNWSIVNGGSGYDLWTPLGGASGGGTYMEGVGVNGRQVDGNYSFALYAGSGSYAISRPLASSITTGGFSILTRFDLAGSGPNLINLRAGNDTSGFGAGELLSFGIVNGNQLSYTDGSGFHTLASGEARGDVWDWNVAFNSITGSFSLSVQNMGGGFSDTVNGTMEQTGTSVGSFGVINSSTGSGQNLIFDEPVFTVPEPTSLALLGLGVGSLWFVRRRD
jgi:PEP-CTERM motif